MLMTGAKNFVATERGGRPALQFKLPGTLAKERINHVEVVLDADDTYSVSFKAVRMRRKPDGMTDYENSVKTVSEASGVYADMLGEVFKDATGLDVRLPFSISPAVKPALRERG